MGYRIFIILMILLLPVSLQAIDIKYPEIKGFKIRTDYPLYVPDNLWDFINGAADNYLALGFVDLHVAEYKKGREMIKLEIYRHADHTLAFGIYASERSPGFRFISIGAQGYMTDGAINFFKGCYYVKIRTYSKNQKIIQAAESLATEVAGMLEGETELPSVLSLFPAEGKKINEETYINESVLGHNFLNKAFKAPYETGTGNFSIYIIRSASPGETRKAVDAYLALTGAVPQPGSEGKQVLKDKYNGTIFIAWKQNNLVLIEGLNEAGSAVAEKYSSEILNRI